MPKTNWQDPGSSEVRSTHISGLQEAVGKIEDILNMQLQAETGIGLSEVYISEQDRYRIFQAPEGKRNWASSPAPVIKKNGAVISSGFTIDYGGGAVIFSTPLSGTDTVTADFSRTKTDGNKLAMLDAADVPYDNTESELTATDTQAAIDETVDMVKTHKADYASMQFGDIPYVSIAEKNYYIDAVNGSDSNGGESAEDAFKTWAKAESVIPRIINHNYTIYIVGDLNEEIVISNRTIGSALLAIRGYTTTPSNHKVLGIKMYSINGRINVTYLQSTGGVRAEYCIGYVCGNMELRNSGGTGFWATQSIGIVRNSDFGTDVCQDCIRAEEGGFVYSDVNMGNGTRYGLNANGGSVIAKRHTQPTGTTANEHVSNGGVIR